MITVRLSAGTRANLEKRIEEYKVSYHPAGYGTRVQASYVADSGEHIAIIVRSASCD